PHERAPRGGDACTNCHFNRAPKVSETAIFTGGHKCTSCHSSHEKGASVQTACKSCHQAKRVVGMDHVPQHADCKSCHLQHNVMGARGNGCANCHSGQHKYVAVDASRPCTSCHNVHGAGTATLTPVGGGTNCTGCHTIATSNRAFHDGRAE